MSKIVEYQINTTKSYKIMPGFWVNVKTNLQIGESDSVVSPKLDHNLCVIKPICAIASKVDGDGTVNLLIVNHSRIEVDINEEEVLGTILVLVN